MQTPKSILSEFTDLQISRRKSCTFGPQPLHTCIVTYITEDILSYARYSLLINGFYSSLYENDFYVIHPGTAQHMDLDHYDARWNKIKLLYDAIQPNGWGQHCDYVMWVDADWIVLDMKWDIAAIVSAHPTANIIVSAGIFHA
jgi:hypothetical protein